MARTSEQLTPAEILLVSNIASTGYMLPCVAKSTDFTATLGGHYNCTATLTVTDPSPTNGAGFTVFVRNGTVTVGGTAYTVPGTEVCRVYHSGAWSNFVKYPVTGGEGTATWVLTSNGPGNAPSFQAAASSGGLTRDLWYEVPSGAYASTSTFTSTEASSGEATRLAELAERSLFTCTDTTGATRRVGYIKSASAASTTVTYIVVTNSDLAAGDKNFRITPNRKVEDYVHRVSIPGEMIADASNPQGVWLLNVKTASYLLPVNSAVRTAAAGAGAACAWNVYAGASNLFSAAQDMTTSATFDEKRPTTNTLAVADNVSLRITSSAGATNRAQDFQAELFIVPQTLYTSQA